MSTEHERVPIRFDDALQRLNADLGKRGQLVHRDGDNGYRLVDLAKAKLVSVGDIERLARQLKVLDPAETIQPTS